MSLDDLIDVINSTPVIARKGIAVERHARRLIKSFPGVKYFDQDHPIFTDESRFKRNHRTLYSKPRNEHSLQYVPYHDGLYLQYPELSPEAHLARCLEPYPGVYLKSPNGGRYEIDILFEYDSQIVFGEVKSTAIASRRCVKRTFYGPRLTAFSKFFPKPVIYWAIVHNDFTLRESNVFFEDGYTLVPMGPPAVQKKKKKKLDMTTPLLALERNWLTKPELPRGGWGDYERHK